MNNKIDNKTIIIALSFTALIVILGTLGYVYLDSSKTNEISTAEKTVEEMKVDSIQKDIDGLDDLDLTELDDISSELEQIDLTEL